MMELDSMDTIDAFVGAPYVAVPSRELAGPESVTVRIVSFRAMHCASNQQRSHSGSGGAISAERSRSTSIAHSRNT